MNKLFKTIGFLSAIAIFSTACNAQRVNLEETKFASIPTVTINGDQCSYEGPEKTPAKGTFTLKIENPKPSTGMGFGIVTLAEGKTLADLETLTTVEVLPEWITRIGRFGGSTEAGTWKYDFDWASNGAYHGEPIYIVCVNRPAVLAVFGPIEVKP